MKVSIKTTKTVMVPQIVEVDDSRDYPVAVYPVQYRNYPDNNVHIQGTTKKVNREYGFAFNIPGHSVACNDTRTLVSFAGTGQLYWNGSLIVNGKTATLVGANGDVFDAPMDMVLDSLK